MKRSAAAFAAALCLLGTAPARAAADPVAGDRRLQFNEYYQRQMAQLAEAAAPAPSSERPWRLETTLNAGYDSNPDLDIPRASDQFWGGNLAFSWEPAGKPFGLDAAANLIHYDDLSGNDNWDVSVAPWYEWRFWKRYGVRETAGVAYVNYQADEDLRHWKSGLRSELFHEPNDAFTHAVYHEYEFRGYTDRNALQASGRERSKNRGDSRNEFGYTFRWEIIPGTVAGAEGGYQTNASNDAFNDFSDYHGGLVSGYLSQQIFPWLSVVGLGGYDFKRYGRSFLPRGNGETERDNYFYLGSSLYAALNDRLTLGLHYLHAENHSNDGAQPFMSDTATVSLTWAV